MTLTQLTAFLWVAKLGSFRAAAEHLRLTQPTISLRIQNLEAQLGAVLFERRGNRVSLTGPGAQLFDYAQRILSLAGEAKARVGARVSGGQLRFGTVDSFALTCMPEILSDLATEHPGITVDLTVGHTVQLQQKLLDGQLDIALLGDPIPDDDLVLTPLTRLRFAWAAASSLQPRRKVLGPADLADLQILTMPADSRIYDILRQWFAESGCEPRRICTCSSLATIVALVKAGFGVSLLPRYCIAEELRGAGLRELRTDPPVPYGHFVLAQLKSKGHPDHEALVETIRRVVKKRVR